ncbi:MAG: hypothetical protein OQJ81_13260, partial [Melioribacteraceae bacterium]|nr:hypothetical protein [Melioribacteraceae bacterium]
NRGSSTYATPEKNAHPRKKVDRLTLSRKTMSKIRILWRLIRGVSPIIMEKQKARFGLIMLHLRKWMT